MKQISIFKNGALTNQAKFKTEQEANKWLSYHTEIKSFGEEGEYEVQTEDITADLAQREVNDEARAYLRETDWYVTRFAETGVEIPEEIKSQRQMARESIIE